jgi:hypothetical protein
VSRSSQEYGNQLGAGMLGMGMGGNGLNPVSTAANPAAGGDIYTVLANMQRNSLSAQQQQRNSPAPGAHMVRCKFCWMCMVQQPLLRTPRVMCCKSAHPMANVSRDVLTCSPRLFCTPLGTPPGDGFHSGAGLQRPGSAQGAQHASQPQQGPPISSSFSFLGQVCRAAHSALWICT